MKKLILVAILLVICAAGWAQGPDNAATPGQPGQGQGQWRRGPGVAGSLTAISGNTLTIKAMDGSTVQVNVTDQTRFRKERQDAKLTDLMVAVPPQGMMGNFREGMGKNFIMGEIKAINGTQIEIARPDGVTQTIAVDENTSFKKNQESVTLADFKVGDRVFGRGEMKDNVFVAGQLNQGEPGMMRRGGGQGGPAPQ